MTDLTHKRCLPCEGGTKPLSLEESKEQLTSLKDWQIDQNSMSIYRTYSFKNYWQTMAFVNAIAWIAHQENHHPELVVGYNQCKVIYSTHAIQGLSMNDFICAAKVDALRGL